MAFGRLHCLGVVLLDVALIEQEPTHVIACLHYLQSGGLGRIAARNMHIFDCFFRGVEFVDAAGRV